MQMEALKGVQESLALDQAQINAKREELQRRREAELAKLGMHFLGVDEEDMATTPNLVNLHPDPALKGCLVYYLPVGETKIGSEAGKCQITLTGVSVNAEVCTISNVNNSKLSATPAAAGHTQTTAP